MGNFNIHEQNARSYDYSKDARKVNVVGGDFGFVNFLYDYVAITYPTTSSEVYTFNVGGSSGTTSGVITLTYSDSTKTALTSVERA